MQTAKYNRMIGTYRSLGGFCGDKTVANIIKDIPDELMTQLTAKQLGIIMRAISAAYHKGRASTGAELLDTGLVYIKGVGSINYDDITNLRLMPVEGE